MDPKKEPNPLGEWVKNNFTLFFSEICAALFFISLLISIFTPPLALGPIKFSLAWLVTWAILAYYIFSWRFYNPVGPDQLGVRLFWGRPIDVVGPGAPLVPLGFFALKKFKATVTQREFPAEPELVYQGEMKDREALPPGMKPPIRITFRDSLKESEVPLVFEENDIRVAQFSRVNLPQLHNELRRRGKETLIHSYFWSDYTQAELEEIEQLEEVKKTTFKPNVPTDGLAKRVTAEVVPVVRWKIHNAIHFLQNIGSEEEVDRQLEDEMVSVLQRLLPKMSVAQAQENMEWINAHLFDSVIRRTLNWGIIVEGAYLKKVPLHRKLNQAIGHASEAEFVGRADKELATQRGQGAAAAARMLEEETLSGRAVGLKKISTDLGLSGAEVQAAEVAHAVADGGNTIVMGTDGFAQLGGVVAAMIKNRPQPGTPPAQLPAPPTQK